MHAASSAWESGFRGGPDLVLICEQKQRARQAVDRKVSFGDRVALPRRG
jgi:hypothetical protein